VVVALRLIWFNSV